MVTISFGVVLPCCFAFVLFVCLMLSLRDDVAQIEQTDDPYSISIDGHSIAPSIVYKDKRISK